MRICTLSSTSSQAMSPSKPVTKPYTPDVVITSSPTSIERCSDCAARWRLRCGRIIRKYAPTSSSGRKRNEMMEPPELLPPDAKIVAYR